MADRDASLSHKTFPWFRSGFDLEGVVGFLAAWLLGILLAMLWEPLFWLGFIPGVIILFATRTAERVTPQAADHLTSPCDGVVVSVEETEAPEGLRMAGPAVRIRVASSPVSNNNVHAPISGSIDRIECLEGEPKAVIAMKAEAEGLARLSAVFSNDAIRTGFVFASGGLGPRLVTKSDAGDRVAKGKTVATRRLGGWCDVYIPARSPGRCIVQPGRTLTGGETILWDLSLSSAATDEPSAYTPETSVRDYSDTDVSGLASIAATGAAAPEVMPEQIVESDEPLDEATPEEGEAYAARTQATPEVIPAPVEAEVEAEVAERQPDWTDETTPETLPPEVADEVSEAPDFGPVSDDDQAKAELPPEGSAETEDPSTMFERLRQQARRLAGEDDDQKD
ncbi:hypothetical protein D1224_11020 [Henriciella barbarensis]|uniref:Phosphatidylserine decarboxylase n=1 Tax=Henriciella barbarensis TaxID=86342 RepID=A0A399QUE6_9PROT|nr:phosphatidylserine decarboxylase [Henriciella barbarensis]RIJ22091.1 hypothetical protein D1224_11020 [Henriciella barbarensis]